MDNTKLAFARTLADTISPQLSDCEAYGMVSGCDKNCPVLVSGNCQIYASVDEFLEEVYDNE